jgi:hypothetical protein
VVATRRNPGRILAQSRLASSMNSSPRHTVMAAGHQQR